MPTYGYACTACGHEFETVQAMTDPALTECPSCGGALRKVFHPVGVTFKGSGFYRTDSRAGSSGSSASSTSSGPAGSSASSGSGEAKSSTSTAGSTSSGSSASGSSSSSSSSSGSSTSSSA